MRLALSLLGAVVTGWGWAVAGDQGAAGAFGRWGTPRPRRRRWFVVHAARRPQRGGGGVEPGERRLLPRSGIARW